MASVTEQSKLLSVTAHIGDCKTLLAFNLLDSQSAVNLAGFTIQCQPKGLAPYYLYNTLQFETPASHVQDPQEPSNSSVNAPVHKFRWLHVPGSNHQGTDPFFGEYTYTVTPRYFDDKQSLIAIDPAQGVAVSVYVGPFTKNKFKLGFTRGYTQSQAFSHNFGVNALIRPKSDELLFDTAQVSGSNPAGAQYTFADEYAWLGLTARAQIFALLNEVLQDPAQYLDVFAYDLNEPDICKILLELASQGRVRIILDNAALHHSASKPLPEDQFETQFRAVAKSPAAILRGHFKRYAHDKVFISFNKDTALKVLTGSTNFSVTGLYVNSNHVLVFDDPAVAAEYGQLFETIWQGGVKLTPYLQSPFSSATFSIAQGDSPATDITFAPHSAEFVTKNLGDIAARIQQEGTKSAKQASVLFAVMEIDNGTSPVYAALKNLHADENIFSYGISDSNSGISLYAPGKKTGVLVTGKPGKAILPPPFDQVRTIAGIGHQIHHKFVVCDFNGNAPVVFCGSSNLAVGGEQANGDNLLAIYDGDIATVFAIEAVGLVDHFQFLDRMASAAAPAPVKMPVSKQQAAVAAGWFLSTTDNWAKPYFDPGDFHYTDRLLFA
ncbi:phospholipase D-like domain-containing protein [Collimonas pratensis]|uniref:phospholipase D n=1 Tax=Collimonas pratensis TaxID=279113 RepID=A0A127Q4W9_9BURK|nr:phospholipase D-like domain-containing protein [Collimonas pratensis]AMP05026.1 PLD-like domain protein [Collimonas pratensis]